MVFRLENLLNSFIPDAHSWKITLLKEWNIILGGLSENVRIESIKGSILVLGVSHSAWAQELMLLSPMLLQKINGHLKENKITELRFKIVFFSKNKIKDSPSKTRPFFAQKKENLTLAASEAVCLKKIKNAELKEALLDYYSHCRTR